MTGDWRQQTFEDALGLPHAYERHDARDTSRAAAALVLPRSTTKRWHVLSAIALSGEAGATDEEIQNRLGMAPNTCRPRRVELLDTGWIEDSQIRRPTSTGSPAVAWILTERGAARWRVR